MSNIEAIAQAVQAGKVKAVAPLVQEALDKGADPLEVLNQGMIAAMGVVGDRFKNGEIFVPEMLIAAKAMKAGVAVIQPKLGGKAGAGLGVCVIGTVAGDLHDIGKNLVGMMIESAGFTLVDLGVDVPADKFIAAVKERAGVKIVALSCLLTTTMPAMKATVAALKAAGLAGGVKVIVGGAPITESFAAEIQADGFAADAGSAAALAKKMAG